MISTSFIGAGNISRAIIGGYGAACPKVRIIASDPSQSQLDRLPDGVQLTHDNQFAVAEADVIVLCIKPDKMAQVCKPLAVNLTGKLFISVAAGVRSASLASWLGLDTAIIRCMPNTPALVKQGMTGLFANSRVTEAQKAEAQNILGAIGQYQWFEHETALDAVTAISGSGPAYYFLVMEAMQAAAEALGLSSEISKKLVLQTALGAAQMALASGQSARQLRLDVTSPGGTTEAAIASLLASGLTENFQRAISAAFLRSQTLSSE